MYLYFVRHGETEYNSKQIIQGGTVNSDLTAKGIDGAIKLGEYLKDIDFNGVYSSPQGRALDTTKYILSENNNSNKNIQTDDRLKEINFGDFDGKTIKEFEEKGYYYNFKNHPEQYDKNPVGETYSDVSKRGYEFLTNIVNKHNQGDHILVVAHCITLLSLINYLNNVEIKDYRKKGVLKNTSVTIFEYDKKYKMKKFNFVP